MRVPNLAILAVMFLSLVGCGPTQDSEFAAFSGTRSVDDTGDTDESRDNETPPDNVEPFDLSSIYGDEPIAELPFVQGQCGPGEIEIPEHTLKIGLTDQEYDTMDVPDDPDGTINGHEDGSVLRWITLDIEGSCISQYPEGGHYGANWLNGPIGVSDLLDFEEALEGTGRRVASLRHYMAAAATQYNDWFVGGRQNGAPVRVEDPELCSPTEGQDPMVFEECTSRGGLHAFTVKSAWVRPSPDMWEHIVATYPHLGNLGVPYVAVGGIVSRNGKYYFTIVLSLHGHDLNPETNFDHTTYLSAPIDTTPAEDTEYDLVLNARPQNGSMQEWTENIWRQRN